MKNQLMYITVRIPHENILAYEVPFVVAETCFSHSLLL